MPHSQQLCLDHCCHVERLAQGSQLSDLYREEQNPFFFFFFEVKFPKWKNSVGVKWNSPINCIWFLSHQFQQLLLGLKAVTTGQESSVYKAVQE